MLSFQQFKSTQISSVSSFHLSGIRNLNGTKPQVIISDFHFHGCSIYIHIYIYKLQSLFRLVCKIAKCIYEFRQVCLFIHLYGTTQLLLTYFMKFDIKGFFENLSRKFKFHYNLTQIMSTLCEKLCTFIMSLNLS